jgi:hypothetical protein
MWKKCVLSFAAVFVVMVAVGCSQTATIPDTPGLRLEQARALTALEVESGALDEMLDEGAALARDATEDLLMLEFEREPTVEDLAEVEAIMRASLAEFLTAELWQETVAAVYAENFTAAELQETVAFYGSPTGQKILSHGRALDQAVGEAVETALEVHHDEFAARVDAVLAERFPELAEGSS